MAGSNASSPEQFAVSVLKGVGAPVNQRNVAALVGWAKAEGGNWNNSARYNPLNTTQGAPGATPINSVGVKAYNNWQQGINATVQTLKNGNYGGILKALQASNPQAVASAIGASPWGTSGAAVAQTISAALGGKYNISGGISLAGSPASPSSPGTPAAAGGTVPVTTNSFNQGQFNRDQARYVAGNYVANEVNPYAAIQGKTGLDMSAASNPLLTSGALTTTAPDPTAAIYQTAHTTLQKLAGAGTQVQPHPAATGLTMTALKGVTQFDGKPVAKWIAPILQYAQQHGWTGSVNSGYRSFAQQKQIYDSGVRPAAVPGTSNHEMTAFPGGAVDVSQAQQLSNILSRSPYAKVLVYAGGKDPVHFSHPHNGSY